MIGMTPFKRLPFDRIAERHPHDFWKSKETALELESAHFGIHEAHVREMGSGPPLLLVHGLMTTSYSWRFVIGPLSTKFRVIAPDLVGCGRSDKPLDCVYSVRNLAVWVGEVQRALGIRGCAVVGNSLGGHICRRLALDDPESMRILVDIHSPVVPEGRYTALHLAMATPGAKRLLLALIHRDPLRWAHRNVHYFDEGKKSLEEAHEYGDPLATRDGALAFAHFLEETMAPSGFREMCADLEKCRAKFPVPLKLIYARQDPMVKPANGEQMARWFPEAEFVWLENRSHFPQVDSPDVLVEAISRWCI